MGGRNEDYELLGAASAAAEGAEEEDGDGTGEHDARGDLQRGGVVVDGEQRRGADFHGAVPAVVVGVRRLSSGSGRLRLGFRLGPEGGEAAAGEGGGGNGEGVMRREALAAEEEDARGALD